MACSVVRARTFLFFSFIFAMICGTTVATRRATLAQTVTKCEAPVFAAGRAFATGGVPTSAAVADFNQDQRPDVVTANSETDDVSVLMGNASGGYESGVRYAAEASPTAVVTGLFNEDAFADIAVVNSSAGTISILLNKGDGTFAPQQVIRTSGDPVTLIAADLNADGRTDLVSASFFPDQIQILAGNGNGSFAAPVKIPTESDPAAIAVGDFNADGKPDLAVINSSNDSLTIFQNGGNLSFTAKGTYTGLSIPLSIAAADLNADGKTDLAVACSGNDKTAVLLAGSDGTFLSPVLYATGSFPWAITAADLNADGRPDLITANSGSQNVSVLTNDGHGIFGAPVNLATGASPVAVIAADLNRDRKTDLLTANSATNSITLLLNECTAAANTPPEILSTLARENPRGSANVTLATLRVNDAETTADKLTITMVSLPPGNITISSITNIAGIVTIRGTIACNTSLGTYNLNVAVTDEGGLKTTAKATFRVTENALPNPGRYNDTTVNSGKAITILPAVVPADDTGIKSINATAPNFTGTFSVNPQGEISVSNAGPVGKFTVNVTVTDQCDQQAVTNFVLTVSQHQTGFPPPGTVAQANSAPGDGSPGSVLLFPIFTSSAINTNTENTRVSFTNTHGSQDIGVLVLSVDGRTGSAVNFAFCLKANQTISMQASDFDPATIGYLIAIAVSPATGKPVNFNYLLGSEMVKSQSGRNASLGAMAVNAIADVPVSTTATAATAMLEFDNMHYAPLPRVVAVNRFGSIADSNSTMLILNSIGGDLTIEPSVMGTIYGTLHNSTDTQYSFSKRGDYQLREILSNSFPAVSPRFSSVVSSGKQGWMKLWSGTDTAIFGAVLHLNGQSNSSQAGSLHAMSFTTAAKLTVPVSVPSCTPLQ